MCEVMNYKVVDCKAKLIDVLTTTSTAHIDALIGYFNEGASWNEYVLHDIDTKLLIQCLELVKALKCIGKIEISM